MGERLLQVQMFFQLHCPQANNGMVVIGDGDGNGVEILVLLMKHLPPVMIKAGFWEFFPPRRRHPVIHITKESDDRIFFWRGGVMMNIVFGFSATTHGSNI